ncbi:MAG: NifU family protein [Arachnia sp.]
MIAVHPEPVTGQPQALRWVCTPTGPAGRVRAAPGALGQLLAAGTLRQVFREGGGLWTFLADGLAWADHGTQVRVAVAAALAQPEGWDVDPDSAELLGWIAADVIGTQLASYISSHGGQISVGEVTHDTLTLNFGGACEHCPAAGSTLHGRIESALAARYPRLRSVSRRSAGPGRRPLLGIGLRRG